MFLIIFPLVVAALLLFVKADKVRDVIVIVSAAVIAASTVALCVAKLSTGAVYYLVSSTAIDGICTVIGVLIAAVVIGFALKYKNIWAGLLAVIQVIASLFFDFTVAPQCEVAYSLYLDQLSLIMAFIIGIVGTGICVYALGYMKDFQAHEPEGAKDRRPFFFSIMFLFLSAMYVIVFSNNMVWLFTGWEVTTVCSFLLIGYTRTEEAIRNAFRQIIMNILGGISFVAALYFAATSFDTLSLADFIILGAASPILAMLPVTFLAFAGITKAAQMPFHTWLLGAMVAPTPTSALLHSSTMVKAGVFLLIKLAPVFAVSVTPSMMVILVGGITFCLASFMAISQSNAKRVLAYSTIANLGLIVACSGVGTAEAVWAAIFLLIFHAFAKSLLFLCVGTAEHHIGSRDIEDMDLLFERMPRLSRFMMLGIMAMFIAPFGMLLSKWATLVSLVETNQIAFLILLAFGSAATFLFWAKWLGKLSGIANSPENIEGNVHKSEWVSLMVMVLLIVLACVLLPFVSDICVEPYLRGIFFAADSTLSSDILYLTSILSAVIIVVLFGGLRANNPEAQKASVYLAGVSADNDAREFRNSLSGTTQATSRNWYLEGWFGEKSLKPIGEISCAIIIVLGFFLSVPAIAALF